MHPRDDNSRLVYSTDQGRIRPQPAPPGQRKGPSKKSPPAAPAVPDDGIVRIQRTAKGRGGKTVTMVLGLPGDDATLDSILKGLKQHCGTGGSRESRVLILQGDQRDRLLARMEQLGFRARLAGG
jgi:translation initiation factor 1